MNKKLFQTIVVVVLCVAAITNAAFYIGYGFTLGAAAAGGLQNFTINVSECNATR